MPTQKYLPQSITDRAARKWPKGMSMQEPAPNKERKPWTEEEEQILRRDYQRYGSYHVARLLGRTSNAVKVRAGRIGVDGPARRWTASEIERLKAEYETVPTETLARELGRPRKGVQEKALRLGLRVGPERWNAAEIDQLIELYDKLPAAEIARRLGRPASSLGTKARELGLGRRIKPLTESIVQRIMKDVGRVPISKIAEAVGMSHKRITEIASANGYHAPRSPLKERWQADNDAFLKANYASVPVIKIAQRLGCSPTLVDARALALGFQLKRETRGVTELWTEKEDALLRRLYPTSTNAELAKHLGRSIPAVKSHAASLGLRRDGNRTSARRWTAKEDAMLQRLCTTESREEIARRLSRTVDSIRHRADKNGLMLRQPGIGPWSAREDFLLRQLSKRMSREKIAARLGRSVPSVTRRMQRLDLVKPRTTVFKAWTEADDRVLAKLYGKVSRKEIAAELGRSLHSIAMRAGKTGLVEKARTQKHRTKK